MLDAYKRVFDPYLNEYFVLTEKLLADGFELKFGDKYPEFCHIGFKETHFNNGVLGTKEDLDSLDGEPVKLYHKDPLMPIALFVQDPENNFEKIKEKAEKEGDKEADIPEDLKGEEDGEELEPLHIENARLLPTKKDVAGYAAQYGIRLKVANSISKEKMLETLEERAKKKGLL